MVYSSLKSLLEEYPYFLDKRETSNFTKSRTVWNNRMIELYDDLFQVYLDSKIRKHVLIWKTQTEPYEYGINFAVGLPYLKKVTCYKNDEVIYTQSYTYEEEEYNFYYLHEDSTQNNSNAESVSFNPEYDPYADDPEDIPAEPEEIPIIPEDDYYSIKVETYNEYTIEKGFPENDNILGNIYDHDYSLDEFGLLLDIKRKTYTYNDDTDYALTEPPYNNKETEDDYHYMNRILYYAQHIYDTPLPLLELWKLFGDNIEASMSNREEILCKMFSKEKHTDASGVYSDNWTPEKWEHKDTMGCPKEEPIYFYALVNDASPIYGRTLKFTFKFYNSLVEPNTDYHYIRIYLNGEEYQLEEPLTEYKWDISTESFGEEVYDLRFVFRAYKDYRDYTEDVNYLESEELQILVKGCSNADYYVNYVSGSDNNDGTKNNPFKTLKHAISRVESSQNVIVLQAGTHYINETLLIDRNTVVMSCNNALIQSNKSCDIFYVAYDHFLDLINVRLKYKCCDMYAKDERFLNSNHVNEHLRVTIPLSICRIPVKLTLNNLEPTIYAHTDYTITGDITTLELTGNKTYVEPNASGKVFDLSSNRRIKHLNVMGEKLENETLQLYNNIIIASKYLIKTTTSDNEGEYSFDLRFNKSGSFPYNVVHPESTNYCDKSSNLLVTVEDMPTTLTAEITSDWIYIGETLPVTYTLEDYYEEPVETGKVYLYEDNRLVQTIDAYSEFNYKPKVGQHTYKVEFKGDSYVTSTVTELSCNVRKYSTSMILLSSNSRYETGDTVIVTGTIIDELSRPVSNASIKLYDGNSLLSQSNSEEDGSISFTITDLTEGKHYLQLKYAGDGKYLACDSNVFTIRLREDELADINLYLYPEYKILNNNPRSLELHVYATNRQGEPISTTFHLWSTYEGEYSTNYTTDNTGWCDFNLPTNAIRNCHGTILQAISTIDEDVFSNIVFIRDYINHPLPVSEHELDLDRYRYSYMDDTFTASGYLIDSETSVIPNEKIILELYDEDNHLIDTTNVFTDIKGEYVGVLNNNGVRLDTLTVKAKHEANNKYAAITDTREAVFYPPATTLTSLNNTVVYTNVSSIDIPVTAIDEFNRDVVDGSVTLTLNGNTYNGVIVNGEYTFTNVPRPPAGTYTATIRYNGNSYYKNSECSFTLTVLKQVTSLTATYPTITFTDPFKVTGTLTNTTFNTILKSKKVYLYVNDVRVASANTNSKGNYSITYTISDDTTDHTLQVVYPENSTYLGSSSTKVTKSVNKETSVITLDPINGVYFEGDSVPLTGKLLTNDNEVIAENIKLYVNNNLVETITPDNTGSYTSNYLSNLSIGSYDIKLKHEASSNYTESDVRASFIVREDVLDLYGYIDSEDETGDIYYGEEFIVTILDSDFGAKTRPSIYQNLEFGLYDSHDNLINVPYEDNIYEDTRIYTVLYGANTSDFLAPGNYYIKVVSPVTADYARKEVILQFTILPSNH